MSRFQPGYPSLRLLRKAGESSRARRRAITAIARRLAIALWRLATGKAYP
ncbi:MAG: hypothetical protein LBK99_14485 [Opitutaceae bacterium]|jgi:hypothetical protein|nr:hypothetical protein [Opitutaceae bacterium]